MYEKELYEKQYGQKKIINASSFPFLRKLFKNSDLHREELVLSLMNDGERLLDVGCGNGSLLFKAAGKFREIYGIDISPSRIEEAQNTAAEKFANTHNLHFSTANVNQKIDLPDSFFDTVTSVAVVEHVFDPYHIM